MNRNQTPARLRHTVALAVGLGCSSAAISIGLGPIHVNSSIGQPMSATIPVDGLTAASAKGATVQLASAAAYRARGIELLPSHQKLRFSLVPSGKGYVIRVTSSAAIREPFVNFLITINSNGSTVTREYAAFFNPDPLNPNAAEPMAVVEKPTLADNGGKGKKKGKKDKLEQPERQLLTVGEPESRAVLTDNRRSEPVLANPKKDKEKSKKEKAKEQIAARKQNTPRAASADTQGWGGHDIATKPKQATPAVAERGNSGEGGYSYFSPEVKPGSIPVGSKYGPVKSNETLFSIANAARPSDNVSIQEMMRAIYNANRNAFARNDMDNLMVGSTLIIPDPGAANGAAAVEVADSGKDKAEAKKAEKAAQDKADKAADAAKAAAAVAATEEALAQNNNSDAKATTEAPMPEPAPEVAQNDNAAEKTADEQAAATPAVELAQNDAPADAANGSSEGGALDGNTLTLDGADSLAANAPQIAENSDAAAASDNVAPADENNAIEIAANDAAADDTVAPAENSEIAAETPAAASVEVASNDNSAATETTPATVPEMKPETIVAVADEKPEDKVSSGLPLPLLAAAGAGALTLGGAAAYMIAKRKRRDDDEDGIEEFSQEAVDRLAAEIDADDSGDRVSEVKVRNAAPNGDDVDGLDRLNSQLTELDELNKKFSGLPKYRDEYDDGEPHSADELPDDFFKDLEIPADESVAAASVAPEEPAAITAPPASDSSEDDDFFSDLEKLAKEDKPEAPLANGHAKHGEFDDFLSLSEEDSSTKVEPKISVNKSAEPAEADDFDDFLAFMEEEDTSAKQPAASEPAPVAAAETAEDDFDFLSFAEEETAAPAKAAEPEPVVAAETAEDDFDFLSFAEEETAAPAKAAEPEPVAAAEAAEDDFDFLSFAEEEPTAPAKAAEPEPVAAAEAAEDDFDFLSFAEDETAAPAKAAEPAPVAVAETAEDDFDFLSFAEEETTAPAKAAEAAPVAVEEVAADDDGLDFFASEEAEKPAAPHTVVSDAVVIAAAPEAPATEAKDDGALDFFALEDEPAPAVEVENIAESKPVAEAAAVADAVVAPAASDADEDVEAMEINLDMATSFIVMGKAEKARSWLDEVMESGSESQKVRARSMLAQLDK